jgi:hypothetical protein
MQHAKFFSVLIAALLLLYGAIGFYCLPLANFQGGLTRMAQLPESLFGAPHNPPLRPNYCAKPRGNKPRCW